MLIKIGKVYVDPEEVAALEFDATMYVTFHLKTGTVITASASEREVEEVLMGAGLLQDDRPAEAFIELTVEESDELRHLYAIGCSWIARDKDGKAYAYKARPKLVGAYWEADDGHPAALLEADYDFLEPGGDAPLEILALLAGEE